jgi:NADPH:quinone reductase-like Zn-dependent oxidoreductase
LNYKAVYYDRFGEPADVLAIQYRERDRLKLNEVLIRMISSPINPSDLIPIRGAYKHRTTLPNIPGYEGVGIVEDIGPGVSSDLIGKRVLPLRGEGTWQEYVKIPADYLVELPAEIDDDTASQLYINPITAWVMLTEMLRIQPESVLLVNACGSALGRIITQLSKILGARVIAVTRNDNHTANLINYGAYHVVHTSEQSLYKTVMDLTNGRGVSAAIDSVGGKSGEELIRCVQPHGVLVSVGLLSGVQVNWGLLSSQLKVHVKLFYLRHWINSIHTNIWHDTFAKVINEILAGRLMLKKVFNHYDLEDIKSALHAVEKPGNDGKILLHFDSTKGCKED